MCTATEPIDVKVTRFLLLPDWLIGLPVSPQKLLIRAGIPMYYCTGWRVCMADDSLHHSSKTSGMYNLREICVIIMVSPVQSILWPWFCIHYTPMFMWNWTQDHWDGYCTFINIRPTSVYHRFHGGLAHYLAGHLINCYVNVVTHHGVHRPVTVLYWNNKTKKHELTRTGIRLIQSTPAYP